MNESYLVELRVVDEVTGKTITRKITHLGILEDIDFYIAEEILEDIRKSEGKNDSEY